MKNSKNIIIGLASVLVLAFIMYVYLAYSVNQNGGVLDLNENTDTEDANQNTTSKDTNTKNTASQDKAYLGVDGIYVVKYTDEGFVPSNLQIPRGKSIRFINNSSKGMRVSSDEKASPTFSELTQSETVGKGSTYTFSFVKEGLWVYYNGAIPSHRGSVVVY
ncbi:MAG: hypothetical protein WC095_01235 [Candidatus Paceibacterota bacterium]